MRFHAASTVHVPRFSSVIAVLFTWLSVSVASAQEQEKQQQVAAQQAQAEEASRRAVPRYGERARPQSEMLEQQLRDLEAKRAAIAQQMAQMQEAERMANREQQRNERLPKDGALKVFSLRHTRAPEAARVLSEILGGDIARMAIDERTNSLLIFSDNNTVKTAEALLQRLDEPAGGHVDNPLPGKTLQLRIVWLLDIDEGMEPTKIVSHEVIDALHELGFVDPKVVCQQVTTLTLSEGSDGRGQFNFDVPVLVKSQQWQLEGQGQIESMADERFKVRFDMRFQHGDSQRGQLGGSIYTPLGHYTVMGTTTFVRTDWNADREPQEAPPERQHLSAFVVYLDRAREFPALGVPPKNRTDVRR